MSRAIWKGNFTDNYLLDSKFNERRRKIIWSRRSTITEEFIGYTVFIHNGKEFIKTLITREKVGFKFGDFAVTRKFTKKVKKKKKKK